ncbi:hypothetical protein As57867_006209, partial [Aphanomyces stellatus]
MVRIEPSLAEGRPPAFAIVHSKPEQRHHRIWVAAGMAYLLFSLTCSILYLTILIESLTNDFWWRQFNTTGGQTFLADVFNAHLIGGSFPNTEVLDLFGHSAANLKDYSASTTFIDMREPTARQWLLHPIPLDLAVTTLRANSLYENIYTVTPYCWVDLGRQFDMAHTAARQQRCGNPGRRNNAAVVFETLLRNIVTSDLTSTAFGIGINQTVLMPVLTLPNGQDWVQALLTHTWPPLADEVALWQQHGLTHYTIQYQNRYQYGIQDKITVVNALGIEQHLKISSIPYIYRGLASWSTINFYWGYWNDKGTTMYYGTSLVRQAANFFETMGYDWDIESNGPMDTVGINVVRAAIGPLGSIDTLLIPPPVSLIHLFAAFQAQVRAAVKANVEFATLMSDVAPIGGIAVDVMPSSWALPDSEYYGGNPACYTFTTAQLFPQMPFGYYDSCQSQTPLAVKFDQINTLFATFAVNLTTANIPTV